jgi:hypothetical protein
MTSRIIIQFRHERLRTYVDAVEHHKKTKQAVVVWVKLRTRTTVFKAWQATKDRAYHVFVKTFPGTTYGVVVGRDQNGQFVRYQAFKYSDKSVVEQINAALTDKPKLPPPQTESFRPVQMDCSGGVCRPVQFGFPMQGCPTCPR